MKYKNLLLLLLINTCLAFSQKSNKQFSFRSLTVDKGLSQNSVISISQDSLGYLWLATQDGLNKYDGKDFKIFNKQFEDITKPTFSKLGKTYIDREGVLWIITNSGQLEKFDAKRKVFDRVSTINQVSTVFQDAKLDFYIGTYANGLYKINHKSKDTTQVFSSNLTVNDFLEFDNSIYVTTNEKVYSIQAGAITTVAIENGDENFSTLVSSKNQTLWLGSYGNGLYYKPKESASFIKYKDSATGSATDNLIIQDLLIDKEDGLWIATYGDGLYLIDLNTNAIKNFKVDENNPFALQYDDILCLYEDYTGTIWFGTDGAGVGYYDEHLNKFNILTNGQTPNGVNVDVIRSIVVNENNDMWLGTSGKGLSLVNVENGTFKTFTTQNSDLNSDRVMSLLYVDDHLWIGFQEEGLQIKDAQDKFKAYPELSGYTIWKIYKDSNNTIWLCTQNQGLIAFNENEGLVKQFNVDNSELKTNNIRTIEEGDNNKLWIGTEDSGLFELNTKTDELKKIEAIQDNIKSLCFKNETLYVGTNGNGIKAFNIKSGAITTYSKADGLPNNVIYGILPDDQGNLWLSSNNGITKIRIENNSLSDIENYTNYDGLQAFEFNTGAYYKDKKSTLYFGGLKGVNWFNPDQLEFNPIKPKTVISGFKIFNKPRGLIENRALNYQENTVTFSFASLHFSQPERNQYKYKLINNDAEWIPSGNTNVAHYTNLPPNNYEFQVVSSNYDGVWNWAPATYAFVILEPWYATNLAKTTYFLLCVLIIFIIYRYLKWRWQVKNQLRFEHEETERLKKLDEFKTKLYTNISHEFRTPLTLISGPIDAQLSRVDLNDKDRVQFELVQRNSQRLLNLVNQLLDLSKLESGSLKLKVSKGNLSILLKQLVSVFLFPADEKKIEFKYNIQAMENVWFDKEVIEKVVTNLLANAVKYTPEEGYINLDAKIKDGQLILAILNNGSKLSNEDLTKLFQRFYQTNKNHDGVGVGLALVKELTTLSHGNIMVNSMNDDDIQFTVTLPMEPSFFNSSEIVHENDSNIEAQEPQRTIESIDSIALEKPLVLVVEDDSDIRQFIASILENEYTVIQAKNGEVGLKLALKKIPDLIISDIMMPVKDGIELCNDLKHDERTSHIPIILLTAKVGEENEITGLKTGADDYMTKPFNSEKLKVRIAKLIQIRQQLRERFSESFDFKLKELKITSVEEQFIKRLNETLESHLTTPDFNAQKFAKDMYMSRMQLHRKLEALYGFSATEFIRIQRLKLSKQLLDSSDLSISEIAYQVGFNTPSYFIKVFKSQYNCTPNEYASSRK